MVSSSDILNAGILIVNDQDANVLVLEQNAASEKVCVEGLRSSVAELSCVDTTDMIFSTNRKEGKL